MYNLEILEKGCEELGITLSDTQKNQFIRFYEYLVEKNKVMNLTGITEFDEVLVKHFLDSLCCVKAVDMGKIKTVMDIGTGAGFPGVPLKIAFPEVEACLLDSLNKRVKFLEETFALLGLEGISAIHGRAEEYAKNKAYREKYDLCVSRAVSGLATLSEYCLPYVKVGGLFVSYKSGSVKEEAEVAEKAVKILGERSGIFSTLTFREHRSESHWHKLPPVEQSQNLSDRRFFCPGVSQNYHKFILLLSQITFTL